MSKRWLSRLPLFFLPLFIFNAGLRLYAAETPLSQVKGGPVSISSKKMVLQNLKDKIIFEGNVKIINKDLVIESERAEVFLERSAPASTFLPDGNGEQQVSKIIASGNVQITKGKQHAKAEQGIYERGKEIITLTGNPEVWEEGYQVKGSVITIYMNEERTLVAESEVVIHENKAGAGFRKK